MLLTVPPFLLIYTYAIFVNCAMSAVLNNETMLIQHLLRDYSPRVRPVKNTSELLTVQLGIELVHISELAMRDQQMTTKLWLRMSWKNELMTWDKEKWGNISGANIAPDLVWIPDIILYNEVSDNMNKGTLRYKTFVSVNHDGTHSWNTPLLVKTSCAVEVEEFPMDEQVCDLKFVSSSADITQLQIVKDNRKIVANNYLVSSEWALKETLWELSHIKFKGTHHPPAGITFTFRIRRKSLFYTITTICPCIIMIAIIQFSFFLPSDSVERISLIVTMLLAIVFFLQLINSFLPRNSDSTSSLSVFYLTLMVESTFALILTCIVIFVNRKGKGKDAKAVPNWMRGALIKRSKKTPRVKGEVYVVNKAFSGGADTNLENATEESQNKATGKKNVTIQISSSPKLVTSRDNVLMSKSEQDHSSDENAFEEFEEEWQRLAKALDRSFSGILLLIYVFTICSIFFL